MVVTKAVSPGNKAVNPEIKLSNLGIEAEKSVIKAANPEIKVRIICTQKSGIDNHIL